MPSLTVEPPKRSTFAGSVVKILYGIDVAPENDRYVAMLDTVLESADAVAPGQCLVEFLPWLRYVPAWVPGAGFRTTFAQWRDMAHGLKDMLVARTKEGMVSRFLGRPCSVRDSWRYGVTDRSMDRRLNRLWPSSSRNLTELTSLSRLSSSVLPKMSGSRHMKVSQ